MSLLAAGDGRTALRFRPGDVVVVTYHTLGAAYDWLLGSVGVVYCITYSTTHYYDVRIRREQGSRCFYDRNLRAATPEEEAVWRLGG